MTCIMISFRTPMHTVICGFLLLSACFQVRQTATEGDPAPSTTAANETAAAAPAIPVLDVYELNLQARSRIFQRQQVENSASALAQLIDKLAAQGPVVTYDCNASIWWSFPLSSLKQKYEKSLICVDYSCELPNSLYATTSFFTCPTITNSNDTSPRFRISGVSAAVVLAPSGRLSYKQMTLMAMVQSIPKVIKVLLSSENTIIKTIAFDRTPNHCGPQQVTVLTEPSNAFTETFQKIYDTAVWGRADDTGGHGSGSGSSMTETTALRKELPGVILQHGIKSMVDTSCGSFYWMPLVLEQVRANVSDFRYTGLDVACKQINKHKVQYADKPWMRFECLDSTNMPLPYGYDLVFSCDALQHLPLSATYNYLHNVKASGAKYLLIGSYINRSYMPNVNITAGEVYHIDVTKPPFNVRPKPLLIINETTSADGKYMLLYEVKDLEWDAEPEI